MLIMILSFTYCCSSLSSRLELTSRKQFFYRKTNIQLKTSNPVEFKSSSQLSQFLEYLRDKDKKIVKVKLIEPKLKNFNEKFNEQKSWWRRSSVCLNWSQPKIISWGNQIGMRHLDFKIYSHSSSKQKFRLLGDSRKLRVDVPIKA